MKICKSKQSVCEQAQDEIKLLNALNLTKKNVSHPDEGKKKKRGGKGRRRGSLDLNAIEEAPPEVYCTPRFLARWLCRQYGTRLTRTLYSVAPPLIGEGLVEDDDVLVHVVFTIILIHYKRIVGLGLTHTKTVFPKT